MRRGQVWWANLALPAGGRPVVLLSRDSIYGRRAQVTVAPVTTRVRGLRSEVALGPPEGLKRGCVANLDDIVTIPASQLERRMSQLNPEKMQEVDEAIRYALGL